MQQKIIFIHMQSYRHILITYVQYHICEYDITMMTYARAQIHSSFLSSVSQPAGAIRMLKRGEILSD